MKVIKTIEENRHETEAAAIEYIEQERKKAFENNYTIDKASYTYKWEQIGTSETDLVDYVKKATKIGLFGLFDAGDIGKTWKCNNCGSKF